MMLRLPVRSFEVKVGAMITIGQRHAGWNRDPA